MYSLNAQFQKSLITEGTQITEQDAFFYITKSE